MRLVAIAIVLVASGCHATPRPSRAPVMVVIPVTSERAPPLIAVRDGEGPWQAVEVRAGRVTFAIRSETYDLASTCEHAFPVAVERVRTGEAPKRSLEGCPKSPHAPYPPPAYIDVAVTGLDPQLEAWEWSGIDPKPVQRGEVRTIRSPLAQRLLVAEGRGDSYHRQGDLHVERMLLAPIADTIDATAAVATVPEDVTVAGAGTDPVRVEAIVAWHDIGYLRFSRDTTAPFRIELPPPALVGTEDFEQVLVTAGNDASSRFAQGSGTSFTLPPAFPAAEVRRADDGRLVARWTRYDRDDAVGLSFSQYGEGYDRFRELTWQVWLDAGTTSFDLPPITLPGWSAHAFDPHDLVIWTVGTSDDAKTWGAARSGQIAP